MAGWWNFIFFHFYFLVKLTGCPRYRESTQILRSGRLLGEPVLEEKQESQPGTC